MNNIEINDIIKVTQMPKVFSQLEKIGNFIDESTKDLDKLECTEENKQEVKNRRAEINSTLKALEERRKEIKNKLLEPYDTFEEKYNKECKEKLENASSLLKDKIDSIEEQQKKEKQEEIELFAQEYIKVNNLENIISFDDIPLNITLSSSIKSLKDQTKAYIEDVSKDVDLINLEEYKEEILLQYMKNGFDLARAKLDVIETHKKIEELKKQQEIKENIEEKEEKIVEKVNEIVAPKEILEDEDVITVSFKVTGTKEKIKKIKELIIELGVKYE